MNISYLKNKNIHFVECENWHDAYGYEKTEMKEDTINYIEQLQQENTQLKEELQQENNYFIQGGRGNCKTYITKLEQQLNLYKEVIEEVETEISSLMNKYFYEKDFCIEDTHLDKLLQILDKAKGEMSDGE